MILNKSELLAVAVLKPGPCRPYRYGYEDGEWRNWMESRKLHSLVWLRKFCMKWFQGWNVVELDSPPLHFDVFPTLNTHLERAKLGDHIYSFGVIQLRLHLPVVCLQQRIQFEHWFIILIHGLGLFLELFLLCRKWLMNFVFGGFNFELLVPHARISIPNDRCPEGGYWGFDSLLYR
ncbi:hypothetical protein SAY87_008149 [Trapa incisa]|uniref:Uncharacterized protein n=1 Tax=Trapa incisa TaxID=236973 RepID=A0AAN7KPA9_9MYRT|nr:hypothetical protein SAY87_008149 [Trapa incisa]